MSTPAYHPAKSRKAKPKTQTWEHPKGSGIRIEERVNETEGKAFNSSFRVRVPAKLTEGKREQWQRKDRKEAERLAEERLLLLKKHGTEFSKIPASVQRQAAHAWSLLDEHNQKTHLALTFIEVVKAGMAALSPTGGQRTFAEVAAELRASKVTRYKAGGLDIQTERGFRKRSELLEKTALGPKLVSQILPTDISKVLTNLSTDYSPRSVLNYRNILSEISSGVIINFAVGVFTALSKALISLWWAGSPQKRSRCQIP